MLLLKITSTPIKYELSSERARLEINQERPSSTMGKTGGTFEIHQRQVQVQLDTFERRNSMGFRGVQAFADDNAARGKDAVMRATGSYADFGNEIVNIQKGATIPNAMFSQAMQRASGELVLVPLSPTDISWQPGGTTLDYTPVELTFDWNVGQARLNFVPGNLSMNITQYPALNIEYLGGPVYVPPSAAPNYEATA